MTVALTGVPTFETERLRFRAPSLDDLDAETEFYASDRAEGVGGRKEKREVFRVIAGILGHWVMRGYGFWALEDKQTGRYCGRCGPWFPLEWPEPEIGWSLMAHAEGKGLAYEAAQAARRYIYAEMGWSTAISLISPDNDRSIRLAERLGCIREPDFDHPTHGAVLQYRHPGPEALA